METRQVIFRFLLIVLTIVVVADAIVVAVSLVQETEQYGFYLFQWENLGLVLSILLSGLFALGYASRIVGVKTSDPKSKTGYKTFILVLAFLCAYCVVVLSRTANYYWDAGEMLQTYTIAFMGLHLAILGLVSAVFLARLNVSEE